jgi:hypothetical protein
MEGKKCIFAGTIKKDPPLLFLLRQNNQIGEANRFYFCEKNLKYIDQTSWLPKNNNLKGFFCKKYVDIV